MTRGPHNYLTWDCKVHEVWYDVLHGHQLRRGDGGRHRWRQVILKPGDAGHAVCLGHLIVNCNTPTQNQHLRIICTRTHTAGSTHWVATLNIDVKWEVVQVSDQDWKGSRKQRWLNVKGESFQQVRWFPFDKGVKHLPLTKFCFFAWNMHQISHILVMFSVKQDDSDALSHSHNFPLFGLWPNSIPECQTVQPVACGWCTRIRWY